MKKALLTLICLAVLMALAPGIKAQGIIITLEPGWNWISYPLADTMDLAAAFGFFTPLEGDIVKSAEDFAIYENGEWGLGDLEQFHPGKGYMYKSNRTETVTFTFQTSASLMTITTLEPTEITAVSAVVGGDVTINEGNHIFTRGICWGTEPNPNIDGDHITGNAVAGSQSYTLNGLTQGNTYYVRAYVVTDNGLAYGEERTFTAEYQYVDLGLPSGTLWATCNVGANTPEGCGDYFAWGETEPKDIYYWSTYQHANGSSLEDPQYTKYCNNPEFGFNGFTDNLAKLLPEDDAATANWGENWCIPTDSQFEELFNHTTFSSIVSNGVTGFLFTASNGNSMFLPVTGSISYDNVIYGNTGEYWSSTLLVDPNYVSLLFFYSESFGTNIEMANAVRCYGRPVRPVRSAPQNNTPTGAINGKFSVGDNEQVYFSQGNLQYQASTDTWRFAENQWDYVGEDNSNISQTYDGWIDLFGWGTSGYHDLNDPYNANYYPWSTSTAVVDLTYNKFGYGPSINMSSRDLTGSSACYDWGVFNAISNGVNVANQWRTLTQPEWAYIFNTRSTVSGIRYAKAKVNRVNGVILLPDDWDTGTYALSNPNDSEAGFNSNVITVSQWVVLENAGAVFLPTTGDRTNMTVYDIGSDGYYWSATSGTFCTEASLLHFFDSFLYTSVASRYKGISVRLVRDVE